MLRPGNQHQLKKKGKSNAPPLHHELHAAYRQLHKDTAQAQELANDFWLKHKSDLQAVKAQIVSIRNDAATKALGIRKYWQTVSNPSKQSESSLIIIISWFIIIIIIIII